jgi:hypothetical protein
MSTIVDVASDGEAGCIKASKYIAEYINIL